jgi:hypothetical protein
MAANLRGVTQADSPQSDCSAKKPPRLLIINELPAAKCAEWNCIFLHDTQVVFDWGNPRTLRL